MDNQLAPTGLAESLSPQELAGKGWMYVDKLQARYEGFKDKLKHVSDPGEAPPAEVKTTPKAYPPFPGRPALVGADPIRFRTL